MCERLIACVLLVILRNVQDPYVEILDPGACVHVMNEVKCLLIWMVSLKTYYIADIVAVTKTEDPSPAISRLIFLHLSI